MHTIVITLYLGVSSDQYLLITSYGLCTDLGFSHLRPLSFPQNTHFPWII